MGVWVAGIPRNNEEYGRIKRLIARYEKYLAKPSHVMQHLLSPSQFESLLESMRKELERWKDECRQYEEGGKQLG